MLIKWVFKLDYVEKNISNSRIIKLISLLIPVCGILYLTAFYSHFNIDFIYFHPLDFFRVFYDNNVELLKLFCCLAFTVTPIHLMYLKFHRRLPLNGVILLVSVIEVTSVYLLIKVIDDNIKPLFYLILFIVLCINFLILKSKMISTIAYGYILIIPVITITFAYNKAYLIEKSKYNFDIILNDNSFLLEEERNDTCKYFIGNLTNYVFIYDCDIEKIRATPTKNIKEIRFKRYVKSKTNNVDSLLIQNKKPQ